jgi:hypothetical protein
VRAENRQGAGRWRTHQQPRLALVKAGRTAALRLDDDGLHAAARAAIDPASIARTIRQGLLTDEGVGPANLTVAVGHVYLTELLTLLQPRAGAAARTVDPPKISGCLDGDGTPLAMIELRFRTRPTWSSSSRRRSARPGRWAGTTRPAS